ncbi:RHS repeat domain-containing protein, partial [Pseudomonas helleri]|uniref:RHS repeat domain-containing protein n=1 Tax=Pseudomonas helleri TaxID=1608996 RepID=UPI0021C57FD1
AWIEQQQRTLNAQYDCGRNIYGWDGDNLAYETRYSDNPGERRLIHYFYEPGSFIPVAQTVENLSLSLVREPTHENGYHIDRDPLWQHQPVAKPFNAMAWYQCDHLGTPMELTDQRGEIAWSGTYQAWGLAKEKRTDSAIRENIRNPLRFQGQYFDTETGLHYNRYRYYDPQVGRFISKDPIGFAGGLNVYAYAPNPVGWVDPFGLAKRPLPSKTPVHRIGGNSSDNLRLKDAEKNLDPPGISVLHSCCPCDASRQMREAFPKASGLQRAAETVASGSTDKIRAAGFDVIEDPTKKFPNHARIIHPNGETGFNDDNLGKLSDALGSTTKCP